MPMDEKKASSLSKRYLVLSRYNILRLSFDARHCNAKSKKRFLNFAITPADICTSTPSTENAFVGIKFRD